MPIPFQALIDLNRQEFTAVLCPWCADFGEAARWSYEHDLKATHDMCQPCRKQFKAEKVASREPFPPAG